MSETKSQLELVCPRLPGETLKAYQAFTDAALSGLSISELCSRYNHQLYTDSTPPSKNFRVLKRWSSENNWQERLKKWRSHCLRQREEQMMAEWDSYRNTMVEQAKALSEKVETMLKHPLVEQKIRRTTTARAVGEEIPTEIIIKPARWSMTTAAQYCEAAAELMRQAVGDEAWAIEYLDRLGYDISRRDDEPPTSTEDSK